MIRLTKKQNKFVLEKTSPEHDKIQKIIEAVNKIEKALNLPITEFKEDK